MISGLKSNWYRSSRSKLKGFTKVANAANLVLVTALAFCLQSCNKKNTQSNSGSGAGAKVAITEFAAKGDSDSSVTLTWVADKTKSTVYIGYALLSESEPTCLDTTIEETSLSRKISGLKPGSWYVFIACSVDPKTAKEDTPFIQASAMTLNSTNSLAGPKKNSACVGTELPQLSEAGDCLACDGSTKKWVAAVASSCSSKQQSACTSAEEGSIRPKAAGSSPGGALDDVGALLATPAASNNDAGAISSAAGSCEVCVSGAWTEPDDPTKCQHDEVCTNGQTQTNAAGECQLCRSKKWGPADTPELCGVSSQCTPGDVIVEQSQTSCMVCVSQALNSKYGEWRINQPKAYCSKAEAITSDAAICDAGTNSPFWSSAGSCLVDCRNSTMSAPLVKRLPMAACTQPKPQVGASCMLQSVKTQRADGQCFICDILNQTWTIEPYIMGRASQCCPRGGSISVTGACSR